MSEDEDVVWQDEDKFEGTNTYKRISCPTCGVLMYIPVSFYEQRAQDRKAFRCIAGHRIQHKKVALEAQITSIDQGKRIIVKLLAQNDQLRAMLKAARDELASAKKTKAS